MSKSRLTVSVGRTIERLKWSANFLIAISCCLIGDCSVIKRQIVGMPPVCVCVVGGFFLFIWPPGSFWIGFSFLQVVYSPSLLNDFLYLCYCCQLVNWCDSILCVQKANFCQFSFSYSFLCSSILLIINWQLTSVCQSNLFCKSKILLFCSNRYIIICLHDLCRGGCRIFIGGGGGVQKMTFVHAHAAKPKVPYGHGPGPAKGPWKLSWFFFYAVSCNLSLIFKRSYTKWDKSITFFLGGGGGPVAPPSKSVTAYGSYRSEEIWNNDIEECKPALLFLQIKSHFNFLFSAANHTAISFLHEIGSIVHFTDHLHGLNDLYFIDPVWLACTLQRVTTLPPSKLKGGKVHVETLRDLSKDSRIGEDKFEQYLQLLARFEIVVPISHHW